MANDNWNTPDWILELVRKLGILESGSRIDLDPCSNLTSRVKARKSFGLCPEIPGDGLAVEWSEYKLTFINPPFSHIYPWTRKAEQSQKTYSMRLNQIIATIPADRTETKAWEPIWRSATAIGLTKKRVEWISAKGTTNTTRGSTGIIYWGPYKKEFAKIFEQDCIIITNWIRGKYVKVPEQSTT